MHKWFVITSVVFVSMQAIGMKVLAYVTCTIGAIVASRPKRARAALIAATIVAAI